ncbi:alpha/beta fold hydrolase [Streptomyces sp. NRRL B-24484]|uniref:thioesterase domain-containing protein n=1 Tax=Streptomyces sp. NRRL B-24484 TaxID=1463833 RepID=UPI0013313A8E|nr:alpha/beta fold hydrolase [Streptomyces sp. NRRL B-24484]
MPFGSAVPSAPAAPPADRRVAALSPQKQALLDALRAGRGRTAAPPAARGTLVELHPGTDRGAEAVVLCPPIGGGVFCYTGLARLLAGRRPVLAVAAEERPEETATVESMAEGYFALLAAAGARPAVLAGWSFGGLVAYEAARRLASAGAAAPVVLLDTMSWPDSVPAWDGPATLQRFVADLVDSAGPADALPGGGDRLPVDPAVWRLPPDEALDAAVAALRTHGIDLGLDGIDLTIRHAGYRVATRAMQAHVPGPYAGPVTLLHAEDSAVDPAEWRARVSGPLHLRPVPGGHYDVVREPAVRTAAELIRAAAP